MGRGGQNIGKRPDKIEREVAPEPLSALGAESTTQGVVKWWNDMRGYGAVSTDETGVWDIWCSFAHVEMPGFRRLVPGQHVEIAYYRADQDSFKYVAKRVRILDTKSAPSPEAR